MHACALSTVFFSLSNSVSFLCLLSSGAEVADGYFGNYCIGSVFVFQAKGRNKSEARVMAARRALRYFREIEKVEEEGGKEGLELIEDVLL